jgi:predicted restriction endonuclease
MLTASHIVLWSSDKFNRGLLRHVICLCVFHDSLFEQGKLTIQDDYTVEFSEQLLEKCKTPSAYSAFKDITEIQLRLSLAEPPDKEFLLIHREIHPTIMSCHND